MTWTLIVTFVVRFKFVVKVRLSKLFWFTTTFPTCPIVAEQFLDNKQTSRIDIWQVYQNYQSNNKIRIHEDRC